MFFFFFLKSQKLVLKVFVSVVVIELINLKTVFDISINVEHV